mmetsp:Transcript_22704/g.69383  ORF Transcript_22704/g.69383 Transcript_22704/m.69383 type:complete len:101 (+) Transcript_22704:1008-1310(+)|eukprot:scaffold197857_cov35-Tisochrysis_lutea.AAC.2
MGDAHADVEVCSCGLRTPFSWTYTPRLLGRHGTSCAIEPCEGAESAPTDSDVVQACTTKDKAAAAPPPVSPPTSFLSTRFGEPDQIVTQLSVACTYRLQE